MISNSQPISLLIRSNKFSQSLCSHTRLHYYHDDVNATVLLPLPGYCEHVLILPCKSRHCASTYIIIQQRVAAVNTFHTGG